MKKSTWINDKGNFCFFWAKDSYKGVLSFFSAILIVLIVSGIIDYFWVKGICSRVLIGVFIAMFIAYNYVSHKSNKNNDILSEESFVREKICHIFQFRHNSLYISKIKAGRQLENRFIYQPIPQP